MIKRFAVSGFRGIGARQELVLAPITVLVGPNSAGKSSLLEAMRLMPRLAQTLDPGRLVSSSGSGDVERRYPWYVFGGKTDQGTSFDLTTYTVADDEVASGGQRGEDRRFRIRIDIKPLTPDAPAIAATTLTLSDQEGDILKYVSPSGRIKTRRQHPLFAEATDHLPDSLRGTTDATEDGAFLLDLLFRTFELTSVFRWSEGTATQYGTTPTHDWARFAWGAAKPGSGRDYDEFRLVYLCFVGEWSLARRLVEAVGFDDAISVAMLLWRDPEGQALLDALEEHRVWHVVEHLDADLISDLLTQIRYHEGMYHDDVELYDLAGFCFHIHSLLERTRAAANSSIPSIAHIAADRQTPAEVVIDRGGRATGKSESEHEDFVERVNAWLGSDKLATGYRFELQPLVAASEAGLVEHGAPLLGGDQVRVHQQYLVNLSTGMRHAFSDVGFGLGQVLPVLLGLYGHRNTTLHIEQPESHLHPALQADLGDAAITSALEFSNNVVIETHSEHLILRLLRRIRESTEQREPPGFRLRPDDLAVYFVTAGSDGALVTRQHVSEDGEFTTPWPKGFFTERLEELD